MNGFGAPSKQQGSSRSGREERDGSPPSRKRAAEPGPPVAAAEAMDPEEREKKIQAMASEYGTARDVSEVKVCIQELGIDDGLDEVVQQVVLFAINQKDDMRQVCTDLLVAMVEKEAVTTEVMATGFEAVMTASRYEYMMLFNDVLMDLPAAGKRLGDMAGKLTKAGALPTKWLKKALASLVESKKGKIGTDIITEMRKHVEDTKLAEEIDAAAAVLSS